MKPKRARVHHRRVYFADLDGEVLTPARSCWTTDTNTEGDLLGIERETKMLFANIGDRLLLMHADPSVDQIAAAEVVAVHPEGVKLKVAIRLGTKPDSKRVAVMKLARRAA